tara:strand:+ start:713 stop:1099 length:387 start_codon:yes stop_codon:yes gene_type:complete
MMEYNEENLKLVSDAIVKNLTPDLIPVKWRQRNSINLMFGHCHHSSACLQKVFTTKKIKLYRALDPNDVWHWWCVDINDKLIDLTADQYYSLGKEPPYDKGEKASMLGFAYRKRTLELLERVKKNLSI